MTAQNQIWHQIAVDFVQLTYLDKFNIGIDLQIYKETDMFFNERDLEYKIFKEVYKSQKPQEFVKLIYKALYEVE